VEFDSALKHVALIEDIRRLGPGGGIDEVFVHGDIIDESRLKGERDCRK
jgi:hypothetical protein